MYIPDIYKNEDAESIRSFIIANGFGLLVTTLDNRPWATHIPMHFKSRSGKEYLTGHISRENPQGSSFQPETNVLAVFTGPHAYISSSWYDHENVPTWNYIAVHIYGKVRVLDYEETIASLKSLVDKYERSSDNPVRIEDLSDKTMIQARGIIAFEIEITEIHAKRKISQNRDDKNYAAIVNRLEASGDKGAVEIAKEMRSERFTPDHPDVSHPESGT